MLISALSGVSLDYVLVVDQSDPEGLIFRSNEDAYVNVTLDHSVGVFNMYLLQWQDANDTMAQNRSTNPISPIHSFENITSFSGILHMPFWGTFVLLFTTNSTDLLIIRIEISTQSMNTRAPLGSLVLVGIGAAILVCRKLYEWSRIPHREGSG